MRDHTYDQAWLHLLDPQRPLDRLDHVIDALVAAGAISRDNETVRAAVAVDNTSNGAQPTDDLPPILALALTASSPAPWRGVAAINVTIDDIDGVTVVLEALVGHHDRTALHFYSPRRDPDSMLGSAFADKLVAYATDDLGGGYVAHTETLFGSTHGAYHLRPALNAQAHELTVTFENRVTLITARIRLTQP